MQARDARHPRAGVLAGVQRSGGRRLGRARAAAVGAQAAIVGGGDRHQEGRRIATSCGARSTPPATIGPNACSSSSCRATSTTSTRSSGAARSCSRWRSSTAVRRWRSSHQGGMFITRRLPDDSDEGARAARDEPHAAGRARPAARRVAHGVHRVASRRPDGRGYGSCFSKPPRASAAPSSSTPSRRRPASTCGASGRRSRSPASTASYAVPPHRDDYAGIVLSLARQEEPDMSSYTDPEIATTIRKDSSRRPDRPLAGSAARRSADRRLHRSASTATSSRPRRRPSVRSNDQAHAQECLVAAAAQPARRRRLPAGVLSAGGDRYPVVYMQDGQNLSDPATAFAGTWELDATIERLAWRGIEAICRRRPPRRRGTGSTNTARFPIARHGGGDADAYLAFLVDTLKPRIDRMFRTRRDREATAILGSSMGGLVSLYAYFRYPSVFGARRRDEPVDLVRAGRGPRLHPRGAGAARAGLPGRRHRRRRRHAARRAASRPAAGEKRVSRRRQRGAREPRAPASGPDADALRRRCAMSRMSGRATPRPPGRRASRARSRSCSSRSRGRRAPAHVPRSCDRPAIVSSLLSRPMVDGLEPLGP